jgi:hypothetical protein
MPSVMVGAPLNVAWKARAGNHVYRQRVYALLAGEVDAGTMSPSTREVRREASHGPATRGHVAWLF